MKKTGMLAVLLLCLVAAHAQYEETEKKGFQKENLFTGGSISLSFFNGTFIIGGNPVFGYRLANWVDAGVVVNYQYTGIRDYFTSGDKLKQNIFGGGVFTRLYPVRFIFAQAQFEHNFINNKYDPAPNSGITLSKDKTSANSFLIGGGYTSGSAPDGRSPFFYLSLLFDVSGNKNSPYVDNQGRSVPVIRAGFNIPLFQGKGGF